MISEMIVVSSSILLNRFYRWFFRTTRLQNDTKVRRLKTIPLTNPYVERLTSRWGGGGEHILSRGGHLHFRTMENRIFLSSYTIFKQEMYVVSWHFSAKNWYVVTIVNIVIVIPFWTSNSIPNVEESEIVIFQWCIMIWRWTIDKSISPIFFLYEPWFFTLLEN